MLVGMLPQLLASVLYLLPVAVVVRGLANRRTALDELALWIPATVAADLLTCLLLARLVTLDVAFLISRAVWLVGGASWIARRRGVIGRPDSLDGRRLAVLVAAGIAAFVFSAAISRNYSIWDRQFHIPLVTALRGQRLPFLNPFQPNTVVHYHFAGDVLAAGLQTFSFGRIHASLALALAHDLTFGLAGLSVAAALLAVSPPRLWMIAAVLSIFFMGPLALLRTGLGTQLIGYSFLSLLCMSFRPHVNLAILLLVGVVAAMARAADGRARRPADTLAALGPCVIALGITDEPSAAVSGLALGVTWVFFPELFGDRRWKGLLALLAVGAGILAANLIFQASLAPGGPVQQFRLVPWRSPGYSEPPVALTTVQGREALLTDIGAFLAIFVALLGYVWRGRPQARGRKALALFVGAILAVATFGLTRVDVNNLHIESHRFATVCEIVFALVAVFLLARLPPGAWERLPIIGAVAIAAVSTIYWAQAGMGPPEEYFTNNVDCRVSAGTQLFERPQPIYIPRRQWFEYAGCRPVFSPGLPNSWETLYVGGPDAGRNAFATLHTKFVKPSEPLAAACPVDVIDDPVCNRARMQKACRPGGKVFEICRLTHADREALMGQVW